MVTVSTAKTLRFGRKLFFVTASLPLTTVVMAASLGEPGRGRSAPNPLKNVYFGEQHLHTSASPDAFSFGTRGDANDAYKFAQGEPITLATTGETVKKHRPYDWAAVTDHAEYLGMMPLLLYPSSPLQNTEIGKLIAFEWSSPPNSKNLHHNVFFRDDTGPDQIFSSFDSVHREDLWSYQERERKAGHENFCIPHNSNVSNSAMFALLTSWG